MNQNRIGWIDTAKGLGLLLVFVAHIKPPYIATWIYTFAMPLFFFLSGLVFSLHPFKTFFKKKFQRLVIPYFVLGLGIYAFFACIYAYEKRGPGDYWQMFVNLIEQKAFWTIWFLAALFLAELILWLELRICRNRPILTLIPSLILVTGILLFYRGGGSTLPWCFDVACVAQFFILLGYIFKTELSSISLPKKYKWPCAFGFLFVNVIAGYFCIRVSGAQLDMAIGLYGNEILTFISAIAGIGFIIIVCQSFSNRFLRYLGRNTMVFFAWHSRIIIVACGLIFGALDLFMDNTLQSQLLYFLCTITIILAVLYPTTELIKKTPYKHLFGL